MDSRLSLVSSAYFLPRELWGIIGEMVHLAERKIYIAEWKERIKMINGEFLNDHHWIADCRMREGEEELFSSGFFGFNVVVHRDQVNYAESRYYLTRKRDRTFCKFCNGGIRDLWHHEKSIKHQMAKSDHYHKYARWETQLR